MKKIYTLALGAFIGGGALAQVPQNEDAPLHTPQKASQQELELSTHSAVQPNQNTNRAVLYYEDFSSGFDGTLGLGGWETEDNGTAEMDIWMMATDDSPQGQFTDGTAPLMSQTADNGWVVFGADHYNTEVNGTPANYEQLTGFLTSPTLDFTGETSIKVNWDQYFRYCCVSSGMPLTLEVSIDGGNSWTPFEAHGSFFPSANTLSANPLNTTVDISCLAADESQVNIRWAFNTEGANFSTYFWGIDDILITSNEDPDDLRISQVTNGDVFEVYEYRMTPLTQAIPEEDGGLVVGTMYANDGNENQENVIITVEILNSDGEVVSITDSEPFTYNAFVNAETCPNPRQDTLYMPTNWEPEVAGDYIVRSTIVSDGDEATPENNTIEKLIRYTANPRVYGHDLTELLDGQTSGREIENSDNFEQTGRANVYTFVNDEGIAWGAVIRLGADTDPGAFFAVDLVQYDPTEGFDGASAQELAYEEAIVEEDWVPEDLDSSEPTYIMFSDPTESGALMPGEFYALRAYVDDTYPTELTFYGMLDSDTDFSSFEFAPAGGGGFAWFGSSTFTPSIRLLMDEEIISVDEISRQNGFHMGQNHPNPATASTMVPFNLDKASDVRFEIYDISGKLVKTINKGQMDAGTSFVEIDLNSFDAGIYSYSMIVNNQFTSTKKMVVQ